MDRDLMDLLSAEDIQQLKDAYAYITVLIAGADGKIDAKEMSWAEKIVQIRTFSGDEGFHHMHEEITRELPNKIKSLVNELPTDVKSRGEIISARLSELNPILGGLDPAVGSYLYKGYVSFAQRIAKASGGILSFFSVGPEEKKWMNLPMLTPIIYEEEEEE